MCIERNLMDISRDRLIEAIISRNITEEEHSAELIADTLLAETDDRLWQNLEEWINGKPISDLWIGEYCINAIMAIRDDDDFLDALLAMSLYLRDEQEGIRVIWRAKK